MSLPARVLNIIRNVAGEHGVEPRDILGRRRLGKIARARQEAMHHCRRMEWAEGKPPSFPQIGVWFGRDHSTVIYACERVAARYAQEALNPVRGAGMNRRGVLAGGIVSP